MTEQENTTLELESVVTYDRRAVTDGAGQNWFEYENYDVDSVCILGETYTRKRLVAEIGESATEWMFSHIIKGVAG